MDKKPRDPLLRRRTAARGIDSLICFIIGFPCGLMLYSAVYEYLNAAGHIGSDQTAGILFIVCAVATLGV